MAVLERSELEASPLADLHAIADQLGLEGFRRLRKAALIDTILGETPAEEPPEKEPEDGRPGRRGPRSPGARASPRLRSRQRRSTLPRRSLARRFSSAATADPARVMRPSRSPPARCKTDAASRPATRP